MKLSSIKKFALLVAIASMGFAANAQTLSEADVKDFDSESNTGCLKKEPVTEAADFYFICKSKVSTEVAWLAAQYRAKMACGKDKFGVFFNLPPSLPEENGIYVAQIEVSCDPKP